jgi:hypothetical protein
MDIRILLRHWICKYVQKFSSTASVRNTVTDSSVVEILRIKKNENKLVSTDDLKNAKAKYIGNFVMQVQNQRQSLVML